MAPRTGIDQVELKARIDGILNRHPAVGLAVGVVRNGSLEFFHGHGLADVASNLPITEDTFRGRVARRLLLMAVMRQRVNATTADIPGPEVPLYLAGARVLEVFPLLPLIANEPLGVGALSYAGRFDVGVVADRDAYPDLDAFAAGMREELRALGVPTHPTSILQGR